MLFQSLEDRMYHLFQALNGRAARMLLGLDWVPMKVTRVTPFLVDTGGSKSWLFVKLDTDEGLVGWGEAYTQQDRDAAMLAHVVEMGRHLIGRDPFAIKHFSTVMHLDYALRRPAMDYWSALSGIEQAMWDIAGKACN